MPTMAASIGKSLKEQLKRKGADEYHFLKLVDDYCELFEMKRKLQQDVKENGVTITEINTKGHEVHKTNPSITEITRLNAAMLKILGTLGIDADGNIKGGDDDEDCGL